MSDPKRNDEARRLPRRRVLLWAGAGVGAGLVGAGGYALKEARERGYILRTPDGPARAAPDHRVEVQGRPEMVVARGKDPERNVRAALERMGGLGSYIERGDTVVVKPNVLKGLPDYYAVTTNTKVLSAVIRACREAFAKEVIVTDGPASHVDSAFEKSGIRKAAVEAGAKVVTPKEAEYINATLPGWGSWPVLEPYMRADKVITVPVVKHHSLSGTTIGMKGWFGAIGGLRFKLHSRIDEAIAGLAQMLKPTLTVVDATRVLMRNGPSGGNLDDVREVGAIAVSRDPVAADAWGSELVHPRRKLGWLDLGEQRGLGRRDYKQIGLVEIKT